jgi:hypothetical protein
VSIFGNHGLAPRQGNAREAARGEAARAVYQSLIDSGLLGRTPPAWEHLGGGVREALSDAPRVFEQAEQAAFQALYIEALAAEDKAVAEVGCPVCDALPGDLCFDRRYRLRHSRVVHPHEERMDHHEQVDAALKEER